MAELRLERIDKAFPGVQALRAVDMTIRTGEVVGLVGENGAGKSTLMRILTGVYPPDDGALFLDGEAIRPNGPRAAARHGIGMVHQEQSLLANLSVAENIFLGKEEAFLRAGLIDWRAMYAAARRQLAKVEVDIDPRRRAEELGFAERQMVELAKVLRLEEETKRHLIILLDEPTSVLEQADIDILFAKVRALKARASFVFVSHRLDEILEISDRVYVMKDGEVVAERAVGEVTSPELHELMVGRSRQAEYYREAEQTEPGVEVVLQVDGVGLRGAYQDVSFELHAGEVLGIAGVIGSGREELSRTLAGLLPPSAGQARLFGQPTGLANPAEVVARGVGYVPRERRTEGIVAFLPMVANITLAHLRAVAPHGLIDHRAERKLARSWVERLSIRPPDIDILCMNLSGGNQQKVVLAKWINAGSRIVILDHPTRGLDVGAKEEVYQLVRQITAEGVAVILTADTLEETIGLSHRILVMRDGRITQRFAAPPGAKPDQVALIEHMV